MPRKKSHILLSQNRGQRGGISILALGLLLMGSLGTLGFNLLLSEWRNHIKQQRVLDQSVLKTTRRLIQIARRTSDTNKWIKRIRAAIALASLNPTLRSSLQSTLEIAHKALLGLKASWEFERVRWHLHTHSIGSPLIEFPWQSSTRDLLGARPWVLKAHSIFLSRRSLLMTSKASIQYRNQGWSAQWR